MQEVVQTRQFTVYRQLKSIFISLHLQRFVSDLLPEVSQRKILCLGLPLYRITSYKVLCSPSILLYDVIQGSKSDPPPTQPHVVMQGSVLYPPPEEVNLCKASCRPATYTALMTSSTYSATRSHARHDARRPATYSAT